LIGRYFSRYGEADVGRQEKLGGYGEVRRIIILLFAGEEKGGRQ
jgi:hypothetical protein